jgi:DNA-binding NarL/FixJ family response regulator
MAARSDQKARQAVRIVFLTIHGEEDLFHAALNLGAHGYILKESVMTEIVHGLRAVAAGQYYVSPALTSYLVLRRGRLQAFAEQRPGLQTLTPSERHILSLIAAGRSSKDIAAELFIHHRTVENHRTNICQKLGLSGPHALLKFALQHKTEI